MSRASVWKKSSSPRENKLFCTLVDFEDAEDVGRGRGVAHRVEPEG